MRRLYQPAMCAQPSPVNKMGHKSKVNLEHDRRPLLLSRLLVYRAGYRYMIPPEYISFFTAMAAVGATLFGLIFVAVSISPENLTTTNAPLERQVKAVTSYIALLNPLVISLFALVPHQQIGIVVLAFSLLGLFNSIALALALLRDSAQRSTRLRHSLFIVASFVLYGYESYFAIRLLQSPTDIIALFFLSDLMIFISVFGVIRAWELIGIRQFRVKDWIAYLFKMTNEKKNDSK